MIKQPKNVTAIPKEIVDFFSHPGGHSLLVEGGAGTGKTTFVLQLLEEITDPQRSFYLSTRVSDETLYNQFPWLQEKEMRGRIIDSSRMLLDSLLKKEEPAKKPSAEDMKKVKSAKQFLESIKKEKDEEQKKEVDRTQLNILLDRYKLPEVERIYDRIESILPESSLLVLDSVEGLTHKYAINQEEFITAIQKDLVEHSGVDLLLVLERLGASHLEYIVDGVLSFSRMELDGRRVRELHIAKLRATEIRQPNYLLTLRNGRFNCFEPFNPTAQNAPWNPVTDSADKFFSTGIPDLDGLLGGGFKKGSYNIIETTDRVSNEEYLAIIRPILLNFIAHNRGVFGTLPGGEHPENLRTDLVRFLAPESFDKSVRIVEYLGTQSEPYVIALGGKSRDDALKMYRDSMTALRGSENKAIIDFNGLDTLEYLRGGDVAIRDLFSAVSKVKITQDVGIGILKPGLKITQEIMNMADTYLRIIDVNKCPCIYGLKPKTIMHAIVADKEKGYPNIKLVPIV